LRQSVGLVKKNPAGHHHNCQVCPYHHPALYLSPVLLSFPISFNGFAWNPSAATQNQPWALAEKISRQRDPSP